MSDSKLYAVRAFEKVSEPKSYYDSYPPPPPKTPPKNLELWLNNDDGVVLHPSRARIFSNFEDAKRGWHRAMSIFGVTRAEIVELSLKAVPV